MKDIPITMTPNQRMVVVEQLHKEYQHICWYYRVPLQRPVLLLSETAKTLGSWDPELRQISVAERLVMNHPWDVVLEVFKHEMAHQYVSEQLKLSDGHGRHFRDACDKLGVAAWARRAEVDLEEAIQGRHHVEQDPVTDRLVRRAEKLMALAGSVNEHESLLAMQRVRELFARHGLERRATGLDEHCIHRVIYFGKRRVERYQSMIGTILNDFFFVRVIYTSYFDVSCGHELKAMDMMGSSAHVSMAEHVYHFLMHRMPELWRIYQSEHPHVRGRRPKTSYYLGILKGFHQKLAQQKLGEHAQVDVSSAGASGASDTNRKGETSMIRLNPESERILNQYVKKRFPRVQSQAYGRSQVDGHAYAAGQRDGRQIVIQRPVTGGASGGPRLLTN